MIPLPAQNFDVPAPAELRFDAGIRTKRGAFVDLSRQGDRGLLPEAADGTGVDRLKKRDADRVRA